MYVSRARMFARITGRPVLVSSGISWMVILVCASNTTHRIECLRSTIFGREFRCDVMFVYVKISPISQSLNCHSIHLGMHRIASIAPEIILMLFSILMQTDTRKHGNKQTHDLVVRVRRLFFFVSSILRNRSDHGQCDLYRIDSNLWLFDLFEDEMKKKARTAMGQKWHLQVTPLNGAGDDRYRSIQRKSP